MSNSSYQINNTEIVNCPLCDDAPSVIWLEDCINTRFMRCLGCDTVYASPRASHDLRYAWLDNAFSISEELLSLTETRRPALRREATFINKYITSGRILDIGCSVGALFDYFPVNTWELHGVELSPTAAEFTSMNYECKVHNGTLQSAQYGDNYFDLVTVIDTLYYMDDPISEFQEIRRILKPGGYVAVEIAGQSYILLRNYGYLSGRFIKRRFRGMSDSSYIYWFSPRGLTKLLTQCGLVPLAWQVIPSPMQSNSISNLLTDIHYLSIRTAQQITGRGLTWAPKYLCLARSMIGSGYSE